MINTKERKIRETGTPALLCFKPEERPAGCRITSVINMKYLGAGKTCIFFHNWNLSQNLLEGKHPSLPSTWMVNLYINFSYKMAKKMIRVRARPPFPCLRRGFVQQPKLLTPKGIDTSRHSPFTMALCLNGIKIFRLKRGMHLDTE